MSTLPPPPALHPAPERRDEGKKALKGWLWFESLWTILGLACGATLLIIGVNNLLHIASLPLSEVPPDGTQLDRIEALAQRASTIAEANQCLFLVALAFVGGGAIFGMTLGDALRQRNEHRLERGNEDLRNQIEELEDQIMTDAERELEEASAERKRITASVFGILMARGPRPFGVDDEDGEEQENPFSPPKPKPQILN